MVINTQIKNFQEEFNYTIKGMEMALRYFYDIEGNTIKGAKGIGILPYIYEDAKAYYKRLNGIRLAAIEAKKNPVETQVVKVAARNKRRNKIIGIEEL